MNCKEYEEAIYVYREMDNVKQDEIQNHIATCEKCQKLFNEVQGFFEVVAKASKKSKNPTSQLTSKVMDEIAGLLNQEKLSKPKSISFFDLGISRWSLAAVSCGILILFFVEILAPDFKSGKIKGPITNFQGAIIKSEDFRKAFTRPKEKKSLFKDCKNILSNQIDVNCVKEKITKTNL